jgi:hypothetical protein
VQARQALRLARGSRRTSCATETTAAATTAATTTAAATTAAAAATALLSTLSHVLVILVVITGDVDHAARAGYDAVGRVLSSDAKGRGLGLT